MYFRIYMSIDGGRDYATCDTAAELPALIASLRRMGAFNIEVHEWTSAAGWHEIAV